MHLVGGASVLRFATAVVSAIFLSIAFVPKPAWADDPTADLLKAIEIEKRIEGMTKQSLLYFKKNETRLSRADERRANTRAWLRFQESQSVTNQEVRAALGALLKRKLSAAEISQLSTFFRSPAAVRFREAMNSAEASAILAKPYDRAQLLFKEESAKHP